MSVEYSKSTQRRLWKTSWGGAGNGGFDATDTKIVEKNIKKLERRLASFVRAGNGLMVQQTMGKFRVSYNVEKMVFATTDRVFNIVKDGRRMYIFYILDLIEQTCRGIKLPARVARTAQVFTIRYFYRKPVINNPTFLYVMSIVMFSNKIEAAKRALSLKDLQKYSRAKYKIDISINEMIEMEFRLLKNLKKSLVVHHPITALEDFLVRNMDVPILRQRFFLGETPNANPREVLGKSEHFRVIVSILNETYYSYIQNLFDPETLAIGAVTLYFSMLTDENSKEQFSKFFATKKINTKRIERVVNDLIDTIRDNKVLRAVMRGNLWGPSDEQARYKWGFDFIIKFVRKENGVTGGN